MPTHQSSFFEQIIEWLFLYKQSFFFSIHFAAIIIVGIYLFCIIIKEQSMIGKAYQCRQLKLTQKRSQEDRSKTVKWQTASEVTKLVQSKQYQRYFREKEVKGSFYNRRMQEQQEIVFSDEEDEAPPKRKWK